MTQKLYHVIDSGKRIQTVAKNCSVRFLTPNDADIFCRMVGF